MRQVQLYRLYRHFKGGTYIVEGVATDSETKKPVVLYRDVYGDCTLWVRQLDMFLSEVDHKKYPDVTQKYRFELIEE